MLVVERHKMISEKVANRRGAGHFKGLANRFRYGVNGIAQRLALGGRLESEAAALGCREMCLAELPSKASQPPAPTPWT